MNNNLTQTQAELIEKITSEFNKLNNNSTKSSFNLIDVQPLIDKNEEIKNNRKIKEIDEIAWNKIAMIEAQRIVELLKQDMPNVCIEVFGKSNGHYEDSKICIQRKEGASGHHENWVEIAVVVIKEVEHLTHGCDYMKGIKLGYKTDNYTPFSSIEDLFAKSNIKEEIRKKIINYGKN